MRALTPEEEAVYTKERVDACRKQVFEFHRTVAMTHDARLLFAVYLNMLSGFMADLRDAKIYSEEVIAALFVHAIEQAFSEPVKPPKVLYVDPNATETKQ